MIGDALLAPARQQPEWSDTDRVRHMGEILAARPSLVRLDDVRALRDVLGEVAAGHALVMQGGDCAEDPAECAPAHLDPKIALIDDLANELEHIGGMPVVRVGRLGGQFAKPRSSATERIGDVTLPVFRGHLVNDPAPTLESRRDDPVRLLTCYLAAGDVMDHLGWRGAGTPQTTSARTWTSHEALLLDYELPLVRTSGGARFLGSTHWPWIGERTRQPDSAHVEMLASVCNPVAVKVGPSIARDELLQLCERLDPDRAPGRLTLVSRMGAEVVSTRLAPLVRAVADAGHPVIWLCDPMHGNTVRTADGHKTRLVGTLAREVGSFVDAVAEAGGVAGGLHLEITPAPVTECAADESGVADVGRNYTSLCDPRLNPQQARTVVSAWHAR